MEAPEIQYARSGDVSIAYQIVGEGPIDLVFVPFYLSIAVAWEQPRLARFYERLASFSRLILFDKRGTGISDQPRGIVTLETQMDDVRAVLDAVGSERAAVLGAGHGGQMCALFAASYPERTLALVLWNSFARLPGTPEEHAAELRRMREHWGRREAIEETLAELYPSLAGDKAFVKWFSKSIRVSNSPGSAVDYHRTVAEGDVTDVLPAIRVPTLVLYRHATEQLVGWGYRVEEAKLLAERIPEARLVAVPGRDIAPYVGEEVADEVERFLVEPRIFATFDGPARAIECARAIVVAAAAFGVEIRAGLHTGECELADAKVAGLAVHIGARVAAEAAPREILVSSTVKDLVAGSQLEFDDRGSRELKGVPGEWRLFAVR